MVSIVRPTRCCSGAEEIVGGPGEIARAQFVKTVTRRCRVGHGSVSHDADGCGNVVACADIHPGLAR
jgi:hypothetical protein